MKNCKACNYKVGSIGSGHCYMFNNEPRTCSQFRARPYATSYQPTIPDDNVKVLGTESHRSWLNTPDETYSTNSSDSTSSSFSSGGGDSGGGGSSGDW